MLLALGCQHSSIIFTAAGSQTNEKSQSGQNWITSSSKLRSGSSQKTSVMCYCILRCHSSLNILMLVCPSSIESLISNLKCYYSMIASDTLYLLLSLNKLC